MKNYYIILLFSLLGNAADAQVVNIPNAWFKTKLLNSNNSNYVATNSSGASIKIDQNNDGLIQVSEALMVYKLTLNDRLISDVSGIQSFANLQQLNLNGNLLTTLNVAGMPNLTILDCSENNLVELTASGTPLITLNCSGNELTSIIGSIFPNVKNLDISQNSLIELDVSGMANLKILNCSGNALTNLTIGTFLQLTNLIANDNELTQIQLSGQLQLVEVNINNNQFNNLALGNMPNLQHLSCAENMLTSIDVSPFPLLVTLQCAANNLVGTLNLQGLVGLTSVNCSMNQISSLNVVGCNALTSIYSSGNTFGTLSYSGLPALTSIECNNCDLTSVSLSNLPVLNTLVCANNQLEALDVSGIPTLAYLSCNNNNLTSLTGLGQNLSSIDCSVNQLQTVDVSNAANLYSLICHTNSLQSIFAKTETVPFLDIFNWYNLYNNDDLAYICVKPENIEAVQNILQFVGYGNCEVNSYCPDATENYLITGNQTFDDDGNGCDVNDGIVPNLHFSVTNGIENSYVVCNASGDYSIRMQQGTHTITPVFYDNDYFSVNPSSATVTFTPGSGSVIRNFCISANGTHPDVQVTLVPVSVPIPGFDSKFKLVYRNIGTIEVSGTVSLTFQDAVLDFISSDPLPITSSTGIMSWNFTDLQPFESREVSVVFNLNSSQDSPALNLGDILTMTASAEIGADDDSSNNTFLLNAEIFNAFDPNDKVCLQGNAIGQEIVGEYLHYMIRFENTGNYPAQFVTVTDLIDISKFDVASLQPVDASHPFVTRITNGNMVEFIFENINLPFNDADNDGYIVFKIRTLPGLAIGTTLTNQAAIYFNYNAPVITNTATTTIETLSIYDLQLIDGTTIYPNPADSEINIVSSVNQIITAIDIFDLSGRLLLSRSPGRASEVINVSSLPAGTYLAKVSTAGGLNTFKFIRK